MVLEDLASAAGINNAVMHVGMPGAHSNWVSLLCWWCSASFVHYVAFWTLQSENPNENKVRWD